MAVVPYHETWGGSRVEPKTPHSPRGGASLIRDSGVPYVGHTRCMANEATCQGHRAKGTEYCIGHLRSMAKIAEG